MSERPAVVILTDAVSLRASVAITVMERYPDMVSSAKQMALITQASLLGTKLDLLESSADVVVSLAETPGHHTTAWISEFSRILKPGGFLLMQEPLYRGQFSDGEEQRIGESFQSKQVLEKKLLLAGFVGPATCDPFEDFNQLVSSARLRSFPEACPVMIKAQKLAWETGSSFPIKKTKAIMQEGTIQSVSTVRLLADEMNDINMSTPQSNGNSWKVANGDYDNDLIDEDSLLTEEDLIKPVLKSDDCEVGKSGRKACKNCTCGRVEMEEQQQSGGLTPEQINNPQSSCGNCGLGDAFRCNSCPYRGLPPFKPGEKVSFTEAFLVMDT